MRDSAPLAKLWFQIPNTAALLICKYEATNANSSSGRKKNTEFILGFYLSEISAGRDCKMLYILSVAKRQLLPESFWLLLIIRCLSKKKKKKKKNCTDFTSHAEHTSASVWSLRRNPDIHAHHLPQSPHPSALLRALFCLQGRWQEKRRGCWVPSLVSTGKTFTLMRHF